MANPLRMNFAGLCRDARTLLDVSQQDLAAAVGVSRSLIAGIETGRVNATLDVVMRIGEVLDLDLRIVGQRPVVIDPRPIGIVHGRCSAYVGRRLGGQGWSTRREVEIVPRSVARLDRRPGIPREHVDAGHHRDQDPA